MDDAILPPSWLPRTSAGRLVAYEINRATFASLKPPRPGSVAPPRSQAAAGVQAEWELCSSLLHKSPGFIIASNSVLLDKLKSQEERIWHIRQNVFQGWSRNVLSTR